MEPGTLKLEEQHLRRFFSWLNNTMPDVTEVSQVRRPHIEAFKEYLRWLKPHPSLHRPTDAKLSRGVVVNTLCCLRNFFCRIAEWGWKEAPGTVPIFHGDIPPMDFPRPRFLEEGDAMRFLNAAQHHAD